MTVLVRELGEVVGVSRACTALGVPRPSYYRRSRPAPRRVTKTAAASRAFAERAAGVVEVLHSERFVDQAPVQVVAALLPRHLPLLGPHDVPDSGRRGEVRERRNQLRHPRYQRPELLATGPNQVWSWDITKLRAAQKWTYYYLYVLLDIFSRYAVGWMLAHRESGELAAELLEQSIHKQRVEPDEITVHADRGSAPTSKTLTQMMIDLGVKRSHSRPRVSNDNPFSESNFHTLKSRPDYPNRFGCYEDARSFCRRTFDWYNHEHHHSGIVMLTPAAGTLRARGRSLGRASARPRCRVRGASRTIRQRTAESALATAGGLDQPPGGQEQERDQTSLNSRPECLKVVDTYRDLSAADFFSEVALRAEEAFLRPVRTFAASLESVFRVFLRWAMCLISLELDPTVRIPPDVIPCCG